MSQMNEQKPATQIPIYSSVMNMATHTVRFKFSLLYVKCKLRQKEGGIAFGLFCAIH